MTALMLAAEKPRLHSSDIATQLFFTPLPAFKDDAERYVWIAAQYKRRIKPGLNKAKLARDIAAFAFEITIEQLVSPSRKRPLPIARHKIICFTRLLTGIGPRQLGVLFNRDHATIVYACRKYHGEIAAILRGSV